MNRLSIPLILAAAAGLFIGLFSASAEPNKDEKKAMPECPVMGEPINLFVKTDTKDGPVHFCCGHCIEKYTANPAKYAKKVEAQRKALEALPRMQVTCPVSGEPVDPKVSFERDGKKVYACCPKCIEPMKKDFAKYQARLSGSYTYQTKCPVSGEDISPKSFADFGSGQRVYFCCDKCKTRFQAEPAKFSGSLKDQGYELDLPKKKP
jgi:YHS domain-containing protein